MGAASIQNRGRRGASSAVGGMEKIPGLLTGGEVCCGEFHAPDVAVFSYKRTGNRFLL
jgi:hypothetical protein